MARSERDRQYYLEHQEEIKAQRKKYYLKNRKKIIARTKRWQAVNRKRAAMIWRKSSLKLRYNLSIEQWKEAFKRQNGHCGICDIKFTKKNSAHTDHCHKTKRFRGLLCKRCNLMLGYSRDSKTILTKAMRYLNVAS